MNIYYVYAYLREKSSTTAAAGTPYYIGKGKGKRAFNKHTHVPVPSNTAYIVLCETKLTEIGAFALERRLIKWYGRKDLGSGILLNRTSGGDGTTNLSKETRERIGQAHRGKIMSPESIQKKIESSKGQIPWNKGLSGVQKAWNKGLKMEINLSDAERHRKRERMLGENNHFYGKNLTDEHRDKISNSNKGKIPWNKGKVGSIMKRVECPVCGKIGGISQMKYKHFDNCKYINNNSMGNPNET